jgi:hypothetical protein
LADSILLALDNVTNGLVIYPNVIRSRIDQELPFSAFPDISAFPFLMLTRLSQWPPSPS